MCGSQYRLYFVFGDHMAFFYFYKKMKQQDRLLWATIALLSAATNHIFSFFVFPTKKIK